MLRNNTDAHISSLGYLCVSIKISISLGKTFLRISRIRNIPLTWILARVFVYLPPFISQILDFIYWTVLILILIYCEWRDTENHGLERRSAGSFPEQRPFVIPIDSRQRSWWCCWLQGWRIRADLCVSLRSDRDVKLIILIIATTIITINIYILNNIISFINIITSIIIIRWWGDLRVWFRVRRRVKRWVQMSCMPCSYEEPCSDQEMRPSLLPWMLVKNLQVLLPFLRRFSVILIGMKYYLNIYYSIPSAIVLSLH